MKHSERTESGVTARQNRERTMKSPIAPAWIAFFVTLWQGLAMGQEPTVSDKEIMYHEVLLQWPSSPGARGYELAIFREADAKLHLVNTVTRVNCNYVYGPPAKKARYAWRVRPILDSGPSEWSEYKYFETVCRCVIRGSLIGAGVGASAGAFAGFLLGSGAGLATGGTAVPAVVPFTRGGGVIGGGLGAVIGGLIGKLTCRCSE